MPATVLCVGFHDAQILDIAGPLQILSAVNTARNTQPPAYDIKLVARRKGDVPTTCGLVLRAAAGFEDIPTTELKKLDTLIVTGGAGVGRAAADEKLLAFVRRAARHARRVVSVCSGTFILAAAGVINTERVATHWSVVDALRERYPSLTVDPDAIYVRDGRVWSSAGVTAGIDLALALVREDWGQEMALQIARRHVVFMIRPGGQAQYSANLRAQAAGEGRLGGLLAWIVEHVGEQISLSVLAARAGMSERTLTRVFRAETGVSPTEFIATARLESARRALERTRQPLTIIARRTGYGHVERLRRSFQRALGVSPSDYRARFNSGSHGVRT